MTDILNLIEAHSGTLCFLAVLLLCLLVVRCTRKITKEIKFLYRREEILNVNDSLRHVPRNLDTDFFHKPNE